MSHAFSQCRFSRFNYRGENFQAIKCTVDIRVWSNSRCVSHEDCHYGSMNSIAIAPLRLREELVFLFWSRRNICSYLSDFWLLSGFLRAPRSLGSLIIAARSLTRVSLLVSPLVWLGSAMESHALVYLSPRYRYFRLQPSPSRCSICVAFRSFAPINRRYFPIEKFTTARRSYYGTRWKSRVYWAPRSLARDLRQIPL